ncbi:MAG: serine/threonine-protein kinase [Candidatus Micrarchaeia archaeon]|jgi:serine/threonine protein kinase
MSECRQTAEPGSKPSAGRILRPLPLLEGPLKGRFGWMRPIYGSNCNLLYKARDGVTGADVVIKIPKYNEDKDTWRSLKMRKVVEAEALSRLNHPCVIPLVGAYEASDRVYVKDGTMFPFVVLPYVEGTDLGEAICRLPPDMCEETKRGLARLLYNAAGAMAHTHGAGVVHGDMKPGNIMWTGTGLPMVFDFELALLAGVTREESDGNIAGTPGFMPPEQVLAVDGAVDARSDIWAFGAVVYCAYERTLPIGLEEADIERGNIYGLMRKYRRLRPMPMRDERLGWVVGKAMQWNPDERFQSMGEMVCALRECWKDELGTDVVE